MSGKERDGERFADVVGDVTPLGDRGKHRPEPGPGQTTPRRTGSAASRATKPAAPQARRFVESGEGSGRAEDVSPKQLRRLRRGDPSPSREIDLHHRNLTSAEQHVVREIGAARAAGERCVRVIHGRGRHSGGPAVLRDALPGWLMAEPLASQVLAWARSPSDGDGGGSTRVLLRPLERTS